MAKKMAKKPLPDKRSDKRSSLFSAVTVSAFAASALASQAPAFGDDYPSWNDVQQAKQNEAAKQAEIDKIIAHVNDLQKTVDGANRESLIAAEAYRIVHEELTTASSRRDSLARHADTAAEKARTSQMRAGLMVAHLSKTSGGELSVNLLTNSANADDLLYQLGTISKLSEQASTVYETAVTEKKIADSLGRDAEIAQNEYEKLAAEAGAKLETAQSAAAVTRAALEVQNNKSAELIAQLAELKDSTIEAERAYLDGLAAERQHPPGSDHGGGETPYNPGEDDSPPDDIPNPTPTPQPDPDPDPVNPPQSSLVETAISFALDQVGKPYVLGAAGPDAWDCSGLTRKAYASAGVYIGNHSATHQYNSMRSQGKLVPFSDRQRGDLIFWSSGYDMYHVAIYLGNGRIVEAANEIAGTRVGGIWGMGDVAGYVGRPTG